jgi:hypothetical protein
MISRDAPQWFGGQAATSVFPPPHLSAGKAAIDEGSSHPLNHRYKAKAAVATTRSGKPPLQGAISRGLLASASDSRLLRRFDPTTMSASALPAPLPPPLYDSLVESRREAARQADPSGVERRHHGAYAADRTAFFRRKGEFESYVDKAVGVCDLMPWQPSQTREDGPTSPLNALRTRPSTEFYETAFRPMSSTYGLATSPLLIHRHHDANQRRATAGSSQSRALTSGTRPSTVADFERTAAALERGRLERMGSVRDIASFERVQHQKLELEDFSKAELKRIIRKEGIDLPGKVYVEERRCCCCCCCCCSCSCCCYYYY